MNKKLIALSAAASTVLVASLPFIASAVAIPGGQPGQSNSLSAVINGVLNIMFPVFAGLSFIIFLIAAYLFLTAQGDPEKLKIARDVVIWGAVALIVAVISVSIQPIIFNLYGGGAP